MTAYKFVTLTCDECGEIHDDGQSLTSVEARRQAKREGWRQGLPNGRGGRLDYCWNCRPDRTIGGQ